MPWREIPPRWWAVLVGVAFGSLALVSIDGPNKGYAKAVIAGLMTAPVLALIAGAMLPRDTSVEIAALVGGIAALGGTGVIMSVARMAPSIITGGLAGVANSYLLITGTKQPEEPDVFRYRIDATPAEPDPELEKLAHEFDEKDEGR